MKVLIWPVLAALFLPGAAIAKCYPDSVGGGQVCENLPAGSDGTDASANAPSLSGLTLLATIPAVSVSERRSGYLIQAQCTAGLTVVFDKNDADIATVFVLDGAASAGTQGGGLSMDGMPHTGRIRIYSSASNCQMAARAW